MSLVERWVSDKLHDVLGISDRYLSQYMMGLATKAKSADGFVKALRDTDTVEIDNNMVAFAHELWEKIPHKAAGVKASRLAETAAIEQRIHNQSYQLLSDSEEDDTTAAVGRAHIDSAQRAGVAGPSGINRKQERKRHIRKRAAHSEESSSEEEVRDNHSKQSSNSSSEDELDKEERERQEDIKERDEFSKRILERDHDKTRQIMSKSEKKAYEEAKKRLQMESEDRKKLLPELRKRARREYLGKRREDKVVDLEQEIEEEMYYFGDEKLTSRERRNLDQKKDILKLVHEHRDAGKVEKVNRYYVPKDDVKPNEKYVEDDSERGPMYEQRQWEEQHLSAARMKFGAKDAKPSKKSKKKKVPTATLR